MSNDNHTGDCEVTTTAGALNRVVDELNAAKERISILIRQRDELMENLKDACPDTECAKLYQKIKAEIQKEKP